ncbi:phosphoribosyltransferase [Streptomyces sp. NPDC048172]|uniref:phosphoribosyltransferase n=1 Tax=Streptomyces sp. NPDC048172 TaxID=3365505 RepID=UPI00371CC1FC
MRNPIRERGVTCEVCLAPVSSPGYARCWPCDQQISTGLRLADRVVPLTYAVDGRQSGRDVYCYKRSVDEERRLAGDAWERLSLLTAVFGLWHAGCLDAVARRRVTALTTVPSLQGRPDPHPLSDLTGCLPRAWRPFELLPSGSSSRSQDRRRLDPGHFAVPGTADVAGAHVVVLEDTWVSGGHAQSAAVALREAGAHEVTVVAVARRLVPEFGPTRAFLAHRLDDGREYDPETCPVTGGACPD